MRAQESTTDHHFVLPLTGYLRVATKRKRRMLKRKGRGMQVLKRFHAAHNLQGTVAIAIQLIESGFAERFRSMIQTVGSKHASIGAVR